MASTVEDIEPLGNRGVRFSWRWFLFDGESFARQGRFIGKDIGLFDQDSVGGDDASRAYKYDVTRDDILARNLNFLSILQNRDLGLDQRHEFCDRLVSPILVLEANNRATENDE